MSEATNPDVQEELVAPVEEETSQPSAANQEVAAEPRPGSADYNFREMRRLLEEQQREIRSLREERLYAPAPQESEEEDLSTLRNSDFLTVAQAKKLAQQQAEELLHQREIDTQEERSRFRHSDYDSVVSKENIEELLKDKTIDQTLRNSPNPYEAAYTMIKNSYSYNQKMQQSQKRAAEADRIQKNLSKPASSNAIASKAISEANNFAVMNEEMRKELFREMTTHAQRR